VKTEILDNLSLIHSLPPPEIKAVDAAQEFSGTYYGVGGMFNNCTSKSKKTSLNILLYF
jgi:hypothetical protein